MPLADRPRFAHAQAGPLANKCRPAKSPIEAGGTAQRMWPIWVRGFLPAKAGEDEWGKPSTATVEKYGHGTLRPTEQLQ
jgi:hypothetical protein